MQRSNSNITHVCILKFMKENQTISAWFSPKINPWFSDEIKTKSRILLKIVPQNYANECRRLASANTPASSEHPIEDRHNIGTRLLLQWREEPSIDTYNEINPKIAMLPSNRRRTRSSLVTIESSTIVNINIDVNIHVIWYYLFFIVYIFQLYSFFILDKFLCCNFLQYNRLKSHLSTMYFLHN